METSTSKTFLWVAVILSLGLIISSFGVATFWCKNTTNRNSVVTVTGSAKKQIKSDYAVWRGDFSVEATSLQEAYSKLSQSRSKVKSYLQSKGFDEKDIVFKAIHTNTLYEGREYGRQTTTVAGYILSQMVEIESNDVEKTDSISKESTELINQDVRFNSFEPQFYYTKLGELKVDMLTDATHDARARAEKIAGVNGRKINTVRSARMGVFQITRPNSTDVSDYGINDTSTIDKEITAVVNAEFSIK